MVLLYKLKCPTLQFCGWISIHHKGMLVTEDFHFQLVTSRVSCQGHMIVMIHFFETVVRYDRFFQCEPQHIPDVLVSLLFISKLKY